MIKENQTTFNKINIFSDVVIFFLSILIAFAIRFGAFKVENGYIGIISYLQFGLIVVPIQIIVYYCFELYESFRIKTFYQECVSVVKSNLTLILITQTLLYVFKIINLSRWLLVGFFIVFTCLILLKRFFLRKTLSKMRARGMNLKSVLIIGGGESASEYLNVIKNRKEFGYNYIGYVANEKGLLGNHLGTYNDLAQVLNLHQIDETVCALDAVDAHHIEKIVNTCESYGTKISIIPLFRKYMSSTSYIDQIDNIPLVNVRKIPLDNKANAFCKRIFDIMCSIVLIILSSPIMLIAVIGIKLTSKGPVVFKQERVGYNKNTFTMYKFRSMKINSEETTGWSKKEDNRRTKFGSFIRKFSIDELPQFFNVLMGDMSIVGPRPELPHFVDMFQKEIPLYMVKHQVKPGITGWAQINGFRGDTSITQRIEHDIYYIENWSFIFDIVILIRTVFVALINDEKITLKKGTDYK